MSTKVGTEHHLGEQTQGCTNKDHSIFNRRYMAEILPIWRKTLSIQSIFKNEIVPGYSFFS